MKKVLIILALIAPFTCYAAAVNIVGEGANIQVTVTIPPVVRVCHINIGGDEGPVLNINNIAPQSNQCLVYQNSRLDQVLLLADAGQPSVMIERRRCTGYDNGMCNAYEHVDMLNTSLQAPTTVKSPSCAKTTPITPCSDGTVSGMVIIPNPTLNAGDWLQIKSASLNAGTKKIVVVLTYIEEQN